MPSLPSCAAASVPQAPRAHAHNGDGQGFSAKAREASRGRRRTPSNGLKNLENLPLRPIFATSRFFSLTRGARLPQRTNTIIAVFENDSRIFPKRPVK